jgi:selenocysteine lyase/cysteine desulfurase
MVFHPLSRLEDRGIAVGARAHHRRRPGLATRRVASQSPPVPEVIPMIACQRHLFDIPPDVAYLNCAYMSPLMREVVAAGDVGVRRKAQPWTISPADFFTESEHARGLFARLIGATADDIAIVPAASYGIATAARAVRVRPGQRILVLDEQFPSNVYAWIELARTEGAELLTVERSPGESWTEAVLAAIDERTAVAALPHCHWTDGSLVDLERIGVRCRQTGTALVVDITQSAGALPFDVARVQPDAAVAASYKWLLGPYSLGFLYLAPHRREVAPIEHNWIDRGGSEDFAALVRYRDDYQPGARRFDVGERANFALMPMAVAALTRLLDWGVDDIARTLAARTGAISERAAKLGLEVGARHERAGHFLGLRLPAGAAGPLGVRLAASRVYLSVRGESMRITPHLYNNDEDVERLFAVLAQEV